MSRAPEIAGVQEASWIERRHRNRAVIQASVMVRERAWRARPAELLDLSPGGCRVRDVPLRAGDLIWVTINGLTAIEATASWCRGGETGIRFHTPLHPAVFSHLVDRNGGSRGWR